MTDYSYHGSKRRLSADEVREKDKETQKNIMQEWFEHNFENPAEGMPYMEGNYIFINGGPYNPHMVLGEEFENIVPEDIIISLADGICPMEWAPTPEGNYYENNTEDYPYAQFEGMIDNINALLSIDFHNSPQNVSLLLNRLLYANIITAVEVYLSDTFINKVMQDVTLMERFVETTLIFNMPKIHKKMNLLEGFVKNHLTGIIWHRLDKVKSMYENTLGITFPSLKIMRKAIQIRHDIIHRNGKMNEYEVRTITKTMVENLASESKIFVSKIEDEIDNKS